ncbi:preprotein translocase subunit YajC [Nocardioides litoris]|uniref:preprotein translocase subunit YajC n=1 Tax=Nocardioides litoris TaxID=1926648 RepID=UPI00111FF104|nr:preprotein translocase subunit YajC [Nocardioides litoris]
MEGLVPPLLLVGMLLVFWLLVVRPGVRRERERRAMQTALVAGDRIVLTSGFFGTVVALHDDRAEVELAPGTVVTVALGAVGGLAPEPEHTSAPTLQKKSDTGSSQTPESEES